MKIKLPKFTNVNTPLVAVALSVGLIAGGIGISHEVSTKNVAVEKPETNQTRADDAAKAAGTIQLQTPSQQAQEVAGTDDSGTASTPVSSPNNTSPASVPATEPAPSQTMPVTLTSTTQRKVDRGDGMTDFYCDFTYSDGSSKTTWGGAGNTDQVNKGIISHTCSD